MELLENFRKEIDMIDAELVALFERRMDVVLQVAAFKKANQVEVLHQNREQEILKRAQKRLQNKDYTESLTEFLTMIMDLSKKLQKALIHDEK